MIGDTITVEGVDYEVLWCGGEGLVPDRQTKVGDTWRPPPRLYNKTGKHSKKNKLVQPELEIIDVRDLD